VSKGDAIVNYRESLATKELRYHGLSRPVVLSCPVVDRRAKSKAESEVQRVKNLPCETFFLEIHDRFIPKAFV